MTDNDIIKDLEELLKLMLHEGDLQRSSTISNALDLINRQSERIGDLKDISEHLNVFVLETREQAIKEFAKRLKEKAKKNEWNGTICGLDIDEFVKEMVGE